MNWALINVFAAVGLGLAIPLAFAADLLLRFTETYDTFTLSWLSCLGAAACLTGFLFVNLGQHDDDDDGKEDAGGNEQELVTEGNATFVEATGDFQQLEDRRYDKTAIRII